MTEAHHTFDIAFGVQASVVLEEPIERGGHQATLAALATSVNLDDSNEVDGENSLAQARGMIPETRYAKNGDVNIAYQVVGDGPIDLGSYAAHRKPVASGRGASGLAGRPPDGSSSL